MITKLQPGDPERSGMEEGIIGDKWISLGGRHKIDFSGRLGGDLVEKGKVDRVS